MSLCSVFVCYARLHRLTWSNQFSRDNPLWVPYHPHGSPNGLPWNAYCILCRLCKLYNCIMVWLPLSVTKENPFLIIPLLDLCLACAMIHCITRLAGLAWVSTTSFNGFPWSFFLAPKPQKLHIFHPIFIILKTYPYHLNLCCTTVAMSSIPDFCLNATEDNLSVNLPPRIHLIISAQCNATSFSFRWPSFTPMQHTAAHACSSHELSKKEGLFSMPNQRFLMVCNHGLQAGTTVWWSQLPKQPE